MKKKLFIVIIFFTLCTICFAQGFSSPCELLYPDVSFKDFFILKNKTVNVSIGTKDDFRSEVILEVENVNQSSTCSFVYLNPYGPTSRDLEADCISVYIDDRLIEPISVECKNGDKFLVAGSVPEGNFKIKYSIEHGGQYIDGGRICDIRNTFYANWIISDSYLEEVYVRLYGFLTQYDREVTIVGKGKQENGLYFLTSGYIYYSSEYADSNLSIDVYSFYYDLLTDFYSPKLYSNFLQDKKIVSSYEYILQCITAANIIHTELESDSNHDQYEDLINYIKSSGKEELRLFRNAIYAKHGYVFKDSSLTDFFNETIYYVPDESVTQQSIKMTEEEKILIEMIQAAEQGKQPEDVFDRYKN